MAQARKVGTPETAPPALPVQPVAPVKPVAPPPAPQPQPTPQSVAKKEASPPSVKSQPATKPAVKEVTPSLLGPSPYPYSIYLGSYQTLERGKKALCIHQAEGPAYWSKVTLGDKGTWYRVFAGYFRSEAEAQAFVAGKQLTDAEVKMTKYTNLIGVFSIQRDAEQRSDAMLDLGFTGYVVPDAQGRFRLYSGAFITKDGAEVNQAELASKGIRSQVVER